MILFLHTSADYSPKTAPQLAHAFRVTPGILVTACHVLDDLGADAVGAEVSVDGLAAGSSASPARVLKLGRSHDVAVLQTGQPFPTCVTGFAASDRQRAYTSVCVQGVSNVDDVGDRSYRYTTAVGRWHGQAMLNDQVKLGQLSSAFVAKGMSGSPVRRVDDDMVIGVVSGRYSSGDGWLRDTVWVVRVEDLLPLLDGVAAVVAAEDPPTGSMDLELGVHPRLDRPDEHAVFDHYRDVLDRLDDIQLTRRPWLTGRIEAFLAE